MSTLGEYVGKMIELEEIRCWRHVAELGQQIMSAAAAKDMDLARKLTGKAAAQLDGIERLRGGKS